MSVEILLSEHRRLFRQGIMGVESLIDRVCDRDVTIVLDEEIEELNVRRMARWYRDKAQAASVEIRKG